MMCEPNMSQSVVYMNVCLRWVHDSLDASQSLQFSMIKASFSFPKIIPKSTHMYTLYTNLSFYIILTMFHYIGQG